MLEEYGKEKRVTLIQAAVGIEPGLVCRGTEECWEPLQEFAANPGNGVLVTDHTKRTAPVKCDGHVYPLVDAELEAARQRNEAYMRELAVKQAIEKGQTPGKYDRFSWSTPLDWEETVFHNRLRL